MIDGIIAIDKPEGISSAAVVARVKKTLGARKVGHTGTLDPFATGLMLCGINKGTRISRFLLSSAKSYLAGITLGKETDTLDGTGCTVAQCDPGVIEGISRDQILDALDAFKGVQMQSPPIYSALKHQGKPLYQLAREGRPVQKPPRRIEIFSLELEAIDKPMLIVSVHCSSGTYIRSLAQDMGHKLGCGAMLSSLRRTETCGVPIDQAIPLAQFETMDRDEALAHVVSMADSLSYMPAIHADAALMGQVKFGRPFLPSAPMFDQTDSVCGVSPGPTESLNDSCASSKEEGTIPGKSLYFRVMDCDGKLAAVVEYDKKNDRYDYCCVFAD